MNIRILNYVVDVMAFVAVVVVIIIVGIAVAVLASWCFLIPKLNFRVRYGTNTAAIAVTPRFLP